MKRFISLILVLAMCLPSFTPLTALAANTTSATLTGPSTVQVGDTITVSFALNGDGLLGVSGKLSYDSSLVTLTKWVQVVASPWMVEFNGDVFLAYDNNQNNPINSNTVLFTATFQVKATAPVDSVINISCVDVIASNGLKDTVIGTVKYSVKAHNYEAVVTAPTCTAQGYTTHTCSGCKDSYKDSYTNAKGHSYKSVVTAPTCTAEGYTTHTCSTCKHSYVDNKTSAKGHSMGAWTVVQAATCTTKGSEQRKCANCSHTETREIAAKGHSYKAVVTAPTCTAEGYTTHTCSTCKHSYVDNKTSAKGHSMGAWTVVQAATCTTKGSEQRKCANCSHTETREIAAKGHSYKSVVTAPTCTAEGYTTHTCSTCKHSYVDNKTSAKGHSMGAWTVVQAATCTTKGSEQRKCANCSHTETREIAAKGHSYKSVVTAPTCTAEGYTTYTCSTCKHSYVDNKTAAKGHKMSGWTVVSGASPMQEQQTCANCTHKVTRTLSSITITTKPSKLNYLEGETFNAAGMVITAKFSDGTTRTVTDYKTSGYSSTPGTKTITVAYGGRTATFTVTVKSKVPDKITSGTYTVVSGQTISKIPVGTTVSSLLGGINEKQYVKVYDKNGKEVAANAKVSTGMTVKLMDGSTVKETLTVVVTGDVNGDGDISITDMIAVKAHVLNKTKLTGAYAKAGDTNGDGGISITDFIQVKAHILGKSSIQAR